LNQGPGAGGTSAIETPGPLPPLTVAILAGGRSERFGTDKLLTEIDGVPSVARVARAVAPLATRLLLSAGIERSRDLSPVLEVSHEPAADDRPRWGEGPGAAMAGILEAHARGPILFVPGDMPWLTTEALGRFVDHAGASDAEVAVPAWASGETENLVQYHRTSRPVPATDPARHRGSGARASEYLRALPRTLCVPVGSLTDRTETFSHLNRPTDRELPSPRGTLGLAPPTRIVAGTPKRSYATAHEALLGGDRVTAAREFRRESRWYERAGLTVLARHAAADADRAVLAGPPSSSA
jgi:molybdopterin-guanine dinucleotide biosynthesis protein A